jgi:outer membrane murein-binding lipoprotein Lpp
MWIRRMQRIWKIKVLFTACMLSALILAGGRSLAQMRQASEQFDRDERRIERRVEGLQKDFDELRKLHDDLRLDIEKRLTKIETYVGIGITLTSLLFLGVLGQLGMRLFDLVTQKRAVGKNAGG